MPAHFITRRRNSALGAHHKPQHEVSHVDKTSRRDSRFLIKHMAFSPGSTLSGGRVRRVCLTCKCSQLVAGPVDRWMPVRMADSQRGPIEPGRVGLSGRRVCRGARDRVLHGTDPKHASLGLRHLMLCYVRTDRLEWPMPSAKFAPRTEAAFNSALYAQPSPRPA